MTSSKASDASLSAEALQRLIKRRVLSVPHSAVLRFPKGFGAVCLEEVEGLLARGLLQPKLPPTLELTDNSLDLANIGWRDLLVLTAHAATVREVLWTIGGGRAGSVGELKDRLAAVDWPLFLATGMKVAVRANSTASHVFHEGKIVELAAAALKKQGVRVVEREGTEHLVDLRLDKDRLQITLSLSGRPLYMRRYKQELKGVATIKEDIAAAALRSCLSFALEQGVTDFAQVLVPFAGSGTLGFEAALALGTLPPWLFFGALSAASYPCYPEASVRFAQNKALEALASAPTKCPPIVFNEIEPDACASLEHNVEGFNAALASRSLVPISFSVIPGDLFKLRLQKIASTGVDDKGEGPSLILLNPPFGSRLGDKSTIGRSYSKIAKEVASLSGAKAGFVLAPTLAVADSFLASLPTLATQTRPFNHGGRTVYLILFAAKAI